VVIMPKRRPTIPIAHADDVPTIAFTDEQWQAIEHAYGGQLVAISAKSDLLRPKKSSARSYSSWALARAS
jgi:hypothetical protein